MQDGISFDQIKGAIGSMVWLWTQIERALTKAICDLGGDPPHQLGRRIEAWAGLIRRNAANRPLQDALCGRLVSMLQEPLWMRNAMVHGLSGIRAQRGDEAACLTVQLNGRERRLDWPRLQAAFAWMSQTAWLIEALTAAALQSDAERAERDLAGWADFPAQGKGGVSAPLNPQGTDRNGQS